MEGGQPKVTYVFTLEQLLAAGATYTAEGNLVIPSTVWADGYFSVFRMDMYHFNKSVKEANDATIDVLGRTDASQRNITLASTFNTCYDTNLTDGNNHLANAVHAGTWDHTSDTYGDWTGYINGGSILQAKTADKNGNNALAYKYLNGSAQARSNGMDRTDAPCSCRRSIPCSRRSAPSPSCTPMSRASRWTKRTTASTRTPLRAPCWTIIPTTTAPWRPSWAP